MIIAGIVCGVLYSQMKTARLKTEANDYIGAGLKLRVQVDNYTHTDRVQVYDPPHEESSSSGGSSVDSDGFGGFLRRSRSELPFFSSNKPPVLAGGFRLLFISV